MHCQSNKTNIKYKTNIIVVSLKTRAAITRDKFVCYQNPSVCFDLNFSAERIVFLRTGNSGIV